MKRFTTSQPGHGVCLEIVHILLIMFMFVYIDYVMFALCFYVNVLYCFKHFIKSLQCLLHLHTILSSVELLVT